jgi:hypothetical protein
VCLSGSQANELVRISSEIAEAERLIHERVDRMVVALNKNLDTSDDEKRIDDMRSVLDAMRTRRKIILEALCTEAPGFK